MMIVCDFCFHYQQDGECGLGLKIPKGMNCSAFGPTIARFCADPKDFVSPNQIVQMATFFGMKGGELKKVKLMAAREVSSRSLTVGRDVNAELSGLPPISTPGGGLK